MNLKRFILFAIILFIIWFLIAWPYDFQNSVMNWQTFYIGIGVAFFVSFLTVRNMSKINFFNKAPKFNIMRLVWFLYYILLFLWLCLIANIDVAYRVLNPKLPIRPGIVKIHTNLKNPIAIAALANSITLTPGTLTMDVTEDGDLYIHWINVVTEDIEEATKIISSSFEKILVKIFE
jgi:multicomponent Na+:H+ antiporter subunit E